MTKKPSQSLEEGGGDPEDTITCSVIADSASQNTHFACKVEVHSRKRVHSMVDFLQLEQTIMSRKLPCAPLHPTLSRSYM